MRLSDVIIMILAVGVLFTLFVSMTSDNEMTTYYDNNYPELNLSGRITEMRTNNSPYYMLEEAITGEQNASSGGAEDIQGGLTEASQSEIGLLSIPGAVLNGLKVVFNVFRLKWFNTAIAAIEQIFGLAPGELGFLTTIGTMMLWVLIFLFIGAVLRWLV